MDGRKTGIYVGGGASHSWTWFADIFDREGYYSVSFLNENDVKTGVLDGCDVFFVSGGDTFAIADSLGRKGAEEIEKFVRRGGIYMGACAGAYLPLRSSMSPLNIFNFVNARIANLTKSLPAPIRNTEKFCTEYGCRYVFHPVREEVVVRMKVCADGGLAVIKAPLYGGPAMLPSDDIEVIAEYDGFTEKTEFLTDREVSQRTMAGNVAVAGKKMGKGMFYLFGPHFEHPEYNDANRILLEMMFDGESSCQHSSNIRDVVSGITKKAYRSFLSKISNARIVAFALERTAYKWLIGKKVYDPEKIRVFIETVWKRAVTLESKNGYRHISAGEMDLLLAVYDKVIEDLRWLKNHPDNAPQATEVAEQLFLNLRSGTANFLALYFRIKRNRLTDNERGSKCTCISPQQRDFIH